jgi:hypothetical protein
MCIVDADALPSSSIVASVAISSSRRRSATAWETSWRLGS